MHYVYILKCNDRKSYIGCTNNLKERYRRHEKGYIRATKKRLPIKLISYFTFISSETAFSFEQYLKSSSGRSFIKKHKLFN